MATFTHVPSEFDLRLQVQQAFFSKYHCSIEDNRVDFIVASDKNSLFQQSFLWAESKMHNIPLDTMFAQLLLTIKPLQNSGEILPPKFLGVFNKSQMSFIEYHNILDIFNLNDLNWNERPSGVSQKTVNTMAKYLTKKITFQFETEENELKKFIAKNFIEENRSTVRLKVNKNNFITVYNKWVKDVFPSIQIKNEKSLKQAGILPCDFFLADLISKDNKTLTDGLKIVLNYTRYEIKVSIDLFNIIEFKDAMLAHTTFWERYQRPPKKEYFEYILNRRELLVPQDIRERKGAYFTPQIWVEKAHEYLAKTLGENWQDEYYIWDCCAGTCNLLAGLTNPYHIWASTLDQPDVNIVHEAIQNRRMNLLASHVFQFDFLNDDFSQLPQSLRDVLDNEEKRKKLIILINPPYAEAASAKTITGTGKNKKGLTSDNKIYKSYGQEIGKARNEIFALFLIRVKKEILGSVLAQFSTLKIAQAPNFSDFRTEFNSHLENLFLVPANTFDNVKGKFPIAFYIWNTAIPFQNTSIKADVFNEKGEYTDFKNITFDTTPSLLNDWYRRYIDNSQQEIGILNTRGNDFQNQNYIHISTRNNFNHTNIISINNLLETCIYIAVRHAFPATWLNDRDQFLYPFSNHRYLHLEENSLFTQEKEIFNYEKDKDFQNDCIIFTLFYGQNHISPHGQPNNWIPFSPAEVHAKDNFRSTFMYDYLKKRGPLTPAAKAVLDAGRNLWTYYHETIANDDRAYVDASLYEIKEYFKGRNEKGKMNNKATDEKFNELEAILRHTLKALAIQIQPKIYEYGFLKD